MKERERERTRQLILQGSERERERERHTHIEEREHFNTLFYKDWGRGGGKAWGGGGGGGGGGRNCPLDCYLARWPGREVDDNTTLSSRLHTLVTDTGFFTRQSRKLSLLSEKSYALYVSHILFYSLHSLLWWDTPDAEIAPPPPLVLPIKWGVTILLYMFCCQGYLPNFSSSSLNEWMKIYI